MLESYLGSWVRSVPSWQGSQAEWIQVQAGQLSETRSQNEKCEKGWGVALHSYLAWAKSESLSAILKKKIRHIFKVITVTKTKVPGFIWVKVLCLYPQHYQGGDRENSEAHWSASWAELIRPRFSKRPDLNFKVESHCGSHIVLSVSFPICVHT